MPTPGTVVNVTTAGGANNTPTSTGTLFAIGQTQRGAVGVATLVTSMPQYIALFGTRQANGATQTLYDALTVFFQEGGARAYISRVSGPSAVVASHTFMDKSSGHHPTIKALALGPGAWGNTIKVGIATGTVSNTFVITVKYKTVVVETSSNLYSPTQAVAWAASYSKTITITNLASVSPAPTNNPTVPVSGASLSGGADTTSPADSVWVTALTAFGLTDGPGQVAAPARTTATVWEGLVNHAKTYNRVALLDAPNTTVSGTITSDASTIQTTTTDPSYGIMLAPWVTYPGPATNTATPPYPRTVAPSALVAALIARSDASNSNCDVAAAGPNGIARNATGVTQTWTATVRGTLDAAGVGVIRNYRGKVQLYGYTSLSLNSTWIDLGNVRLRMQIIDGVRKIGDGFEFADIDAAGHTASALGGQITAFLDTLYTDGALFGSAAATAFSVNVGPSINTPTTAAARELIAQVAVRMNPTADQVVINVTKYPVTQAIPV